MGRHQECAVTYTYKGIPFTKVTMVLSPVKTSSLQDN